MDWNTIITLGLTVLLNLMTYFTMRQQMRSRAVKLDQELEEDRKRLDHHREDLNDCLKRLGECEKSKESLQMRLASLVAEIGELRSELIEALIRADKK